MVATSKDKTDPQATDGTSSDRSNCIAKSRPMLTEAEKEARRVGRILSNRASALEAIRRKQAIYVDLKRRAADTLEENDNLKKFLSNTHSSTSYNYITGEKEKELALKEYALLKQRNEFLKAQMSKIKKSGKTREDPKSSSAQMSNSATSSQVVTYLLPSVIPISDVSQFHHVLSPSNITQSMHGGGMSCLHQGTLYVVPVPCLLPVVANTRQCNICSSDNKGDRVSTTNQFQASDSMKTVVPDEETVRLTENFEVDDEIPDLNVVPATNSGTSSLESVIPQKNKKLVSKEVSVNAYQARRRRKELMKMKDVSLGLRKSNSLKY